MSMPVRFLTAVTLLAAAALITAAAVDFARRDTSPSRGADAAGRASASAPGADADVPFRYDIDYPFMRYSAASRSDRIADVERRIAAGEFRLDPKPPRGRLDALLGALDIDPASQVLVFSATSLQAGSIRARTPRAIYFNDDVYVAWVQGGGPIEIASMDPRLGPVFYTLEHRGSAAFERQTHKCLRCHDSYSLAGGGVPRFLVGSGYVGTRGNLVTHEGWILTTQRTPLRHRWGGWYVTGRHGDAVHLGNIVVRNVADLTDLERLRIGNVDTLEGLVDTAPYAAPGSDIVALLVMQHQIDVQNRIAAATYAISAALHAAGASAADAAVADSIEPLVEAMLFVGEAPLPAPVSGSLDFRTGFERRGPFDAAGRSLRQLDLERRLMRHPLSYLVYSEAFDGLPQIGKQAVYRRFVDVLTGRDRDEKFAHLTDADRGTVLEILAATKPDFAAALDAAEPLRETSGPLPGAKR